MKKIFGLVAVTLAAAISVFANSDVEKFIQNWGEGYTNSAISFLYNMEENWIPIEFLQWAKEGELSENARKFHSNFKYEDFELLNIIFINDKAILQLPYGKQSFKMLNVSTNKNGYFVMLSKMKIEEESKNAGVISKIWNAKGEKVSMNFSFADSILTVSNEYNTEFHQYVKVTDEGLLKLFDAICKNEKLDSNDYNDIFGSAYGKRKNYHVVKENNFYKNNCNLKLRSAETPSTAVVAIMASGTNVKILELGNEEIIDGISSYWVKVEVLSGAKDSHGKIIEAGTVGWCYGGYLE